VPFCAIIRLYDRELSRLNRVVGRSLAFSMGSLIDAEALADLNEAVRLVYNNRGDAHLDIGEPDSAIADVLLAPRGPADPACFSAFVCGVVKILIGRLARTYEVRLLMLCEP